MALTLPISVLNAKPIIIAALGDSLTHGYGLPSESGLVPQLERWMNANGSDVHILNAGVSGDTTAGGLARTEWTLTPDVQVLMVLLGGNDFMRGVNPETSHKNLAAILTIAAKHDLPVLLVGVPAPGNFGPDYKAKMNAMYPELAAEFNVRLLENYFAPMIDQSTGLPEPQYMQSDGIHPNTAGVETAVLVLGPALQLLIQNLRGYRF